MKILESFKNNDTVCIELFGKPTVLTVFSTGDSNYEDKNDEENFLFNQEELDCLNWFINSVKIDDYRKEITKYCNECYDMIGDMEINEDDLEGEISIDAIAVNISEITQSKYGHVYPEISFLGECECDPEHGICIGFRDKKFLGISSQDWTL